jgi:quercetin dioxygenase-like cupin family protein
MPAKEQQKRTNYTVKNVETVAAGKDVRARLFTLAPGEVIPWHSHSEIADHFFVLDGELTVETRAPDDVPLASASATRSIQDTPTRLRIAEQEIVDF